MISIKKTVPFPNNFLKFAFQPISVAARCNTTRFFISLRDVHYRSFFFFPTEKLKTRCQDFVFVFKRNASNDGMKIQNERLKTEMHRAAENAVKIIKKKKEEKERKGRKKRKRKGEGGGGKIRPTHRGSRGNNFANLCIIYSLYAVYAYKRTREIPQIISRMPWIVTIYR